MTTEAERKAMEWLDGAHTHWMPNSDNECRDIIKAMLSRSALPEDIDDKMVEAIWSASHGYDSHRQIAEQIIVAIRDRLNAPKTKTVWIVTVEEVDNNSGRTCVCEEMAVEYARSFLSRPGAFVTISTREVLA